MSETIDTGPRKPANGAVVRTVATSPTPEEIAALDLIAKWTSLGALAGLALSALVNRKAGPFKVARRTLAFGVLGLAAGASKATIDAAWARDDCLSDLYVHRD